MTLMTAHLEVLAVLQLGLVPKRYLQKLNGEYLLNETWHRQSGKYVGKYEGSPTLSPNFMNFGPQKAYDGTALFTHPHYFFSPSPSHTL